MVIERILDKNYNEAKNQEKNKELKIIEIPEEEVMKHNRKVYEMYSKEYFDYLKELEREACKKRDLFIGMSLV